MSEGMKRGLKVVIPIIVAVIIGMIQPPDGLTQQAMAYMGIFECVVVWLLLGAVPDWAAFTACIAAYLLFNVGDFKTVMAPFADTTIWLLIGAFGLSCVLIKTGLVKRLAFSILRLFPETYRGQVSAFYVTGIVVTPFIPAVLGKGVIMAPIVTAASKALGYAKRSKAAVGLFMATWVSVVILAHGFLTGAAPAMITIGMLPEAERASWTWMQWFLSCSVWLIVVAVLSYVAIIFMYGPRKNGKGDNANGEGGAAAPVLEEHFAKHQLEKMGKMFKDEKTAAVLLVLAIIGWVFGSSVGISAAVVAVVLLAVMAVLGLLETRDFIEGIPWDTVVFIGGILSLAALLTQSGISTWLAAIMAPIAGPVVGNPYLCVLTICIMTYVLRLVVVSSIATQVILLAVFGGVATAAGVNLFVVLFVCLAGTHVWHFKFTNNLFVPMLGATKGEMCEHADTIGFDFAYMGINLIACLASVPLWQMMGMM